MGKAEVGSTKWLSNNMKAKGLQRLRWYCQPCQRQMRDENGFKQHCLSEAHNRTMQTVSEDSRKYINQYSEDFKKDFLRLLRTAHGEKKVQANHFYQEYISDKQHVHMNATKWPSLTEFVKYLGREGICRVEEGERGMEIAWVDDSPEALRRREAVAKKDRMDRGDEERQARILEAQIKKAQEQRKEQQALQLDEDKPAAFERKQDGPISFSFGAPAKAAEPITEPTAELKAKEEHAKDEAGATGNGEAEDATTGVKAAAPPAMSFNMSNGVAKSKPVNVFSSKSNPLKQKKSTVVEEAKKMSELERVMLMDKEEQDRKRQRPHGGEGDRGKRIRL